MANCAPPLNRNCTLFKGFYQNTGSSPFAIKFEPHFIFLNGEFGIQKGAPLVAAPLHAGTAKVLMGLMHNSKGIARRGIDSNL